MRSLLLLCLLALPVTAQEVSLFTAEGLPAVANADYASQIYVLGDTRAALESLRFPYTGSEAAAMATASERLASPEGQRAIERLRTRANAAAMSRLLGIERLPAVLVEPGYVVYGVYDVAEALDRVEHYRATH